MGIPPRTWREHGFPDTLSQYTGVPQNEHARTRTIPVAAMDDGKVATCPSEPTPSLMCFVDFRQRVALNRRSPFESVDRIDSAAPKMLKGFRWARFPDWRFVAFGRSRDLALAVDRDG